MNDKLPPEERSWMLEQLAHLISLRGHEPFTVWPVVETNDQFSPDQWDGDGASVWRITRRLMHYLPEVRELLTR